jgi:hypothetical protein
VKLAYRRILTAQRRAAYTGSARVALFDKRDELIGYALRSTCDALVLRGYLDEDQSRLSDDGHGDFEYVLTSSGLGAATNVAVPQKKGGAA